MSQTVLNIKSTESSSMIPEFCMFTPTKETIELILPWVYTNACTSLENRLHYLFSKQGQNHFPVHLSMCNLPKNV